MAKKQYVYHAPSEACWEAEFPHGGETQRWMLQGRLTEPLNLQGMIELYNANQSEGKPVPASADLVWAFATASYNTREENPEFSKSLRDFLQKSFRKFSNAFTRIDYMPGRKKDAMVHNPQTADEYSIRGNFVGNNGRIGSLGNKKIIPVFLGDVNIKRINAVSNHINDTPAYLWRENAKPEQEVISRVGGFYADSDRLVLGCNWDPSGQDPVFRVSRVE